MIKKYFELFSYYTSFGRKSIIEKMSNNVTTNIVIRRQNTWFRVFANAVEVCARPQEQIGLWENLTKLSRIFVHYRSFEIDLPVLSEVFKTVEISSPCDKSRINRQTTSPKGTQSWRANGKARTSSGGPNCIDSIIELLLPMKIPETLFFHCIQLNVMWRSRIYLW